MTRPSHLRIVASGDDWATELRRRNENLRRFDELRAEVAKREQRTRTIRCTIGFLAANWFAAGIAGFSIGYFVCEAFR